MRTHYQMQQGLRGIIKVTLSLICCVMLLAPAVSFARAVQSADRSFSRAIGYYVEGEDERAKSVLEETLRANPDHSKAQELYEELGGNTGQFSNSVESSSVSSTKQVEDEKNNLSRQMGSLLASNAFSSDSESKNNLQFASEKFNPLPEEKRNKKRPPVPDLKAKPADSVEHINSNFRAPEGREEAIYGLSVRSYEDRVRFIVKATGTVDFITSRIFNPPMIIIDLPNTVNQLPKSPLEINLKEVLRVRHSQYRVEPMNISRVVIDLEEWNDNYRVYRPSPGDEIIIDVFDEKKPRKKETEEPLPPDKLVEDERGTMVKSVGTVSDEIDLKTVSDKPLALELTGPEGKPLAGKEVNFAVIRGDGRVDANRAKPGFQAKTVTDKNGHASARFQAGTKSGLNIVRARVPEYDLSVNYKINVSSGEPAKLAVISGDQQRISHGSEIPKPLVVQVRDQYGNPVPDVRVRFSEETGRGLLDINPDEEGIQTSARSDEDGRVEIGFYRIGPSTKENIVKASVFRPGGKNLTAQFTVYGSPVLITLDFEDAPLVGIVRTLAEIANFNIAMPEEIDGYFLEDMLVTVYLQEVPALLALDTILDMKGLTRVAEGNIMKIVSKTEAYREGVPVLTPDELSDQEGNNLVTVTYNLRFLEATSDLSGRLRDALMGANSSIVADESSNALVITDLVNNQRRLYKVLQQIDRPDQLFEVRVFKLEYRNAEKMGQNIMSLLPTGQGNVVHNPSTNALLVFADPSLMEKIENIVEAMDSSGVLPERFDVITLEGYDVEQISAQVNAVLGLQPVPLSEILDFDIDIEDAEDLTSMLKAGRTIEINSLLASASVIPLADVDRILIFGPKDIRDMALRIIDQLKRDAGEYLRQQSWRWISIHNLPMDEAERLINRMGGINIQAKMTISQAFLVSADSEEKINMFENFMNRVDRDAELNPNREIVVYTPQFVDPEDLGDDLETYYEDLYDANAPEAEAEVAPRVLFAGENRLVIVVSSAEAQFVRRLLSQLDEHFNEDLVALTYMPSYLDASELASQLEDRNIGRPLYDDDNRLSLLVPRSQKNKIKSLIENIDSPGQATSVVYLRHTRAEEIVKSLTSIEEDMDLNVTFSHDKPSNSIIFTAPRKNVSEIESLINRLDRWQKQVFIEGVILEYNLDESQDLGIQWFLNPAQGEGLDVGSVQFDEVGARSLEGFTAFLNREDFQAVFKAVVGLSKTEVLAKPQIMAINGEEAMIRVGDEQQIEISRQTSEGLVTSLEAVEAYTQLKVTPTITEDRYVRMDLGISSDAFSAPGGRAITQTTRRTTENSVLVQDGQTVVIGGLIQESEESTDYGIPFLKDIPVLGHLFKTTGVTTNKRELVVFLTPHVAENPAEVKRTTQRVSDDLQQLSPLPVNINIAPAARLARLQGLAPGGTEENRLELAENIVEYRKQNGPFRSYKELENVPGITDDIIANIIYRTELRIDLNTVSIDDLVALKEIDHQLARKIINEREKRRLFKAVSPVRKMILDSNVDSSYYDEYLRQIFYVTGMRDSMGEAPAQPIRTPRLPNDEKSDTAPDSKQSDWQRETLPGLPQE